MMTENNVVHQEMAFDILKVKSYHFVSTKESIVKGVIIPYDNYYLVFCPMEISIQVYKLDKLGDRADYVSEFYMDNDELIDHRIFKMFVEDKLTATNLMAISKKVIIKYLERKNKIKKEND